MGFSFLDLLGLGAQALFLLAQFGLNSAPKSSASYLDLDVLVVWIRAAHDPLDGLLFGLALLHPVTGDQLLGFVEGPSITERWPPENSPVSLRARLKPFTGEHHAGFYQFFVGLTHLGLGITPASESLVA